MSKQKYYSLSKIDAKKATYNVIFGERSNGKTFAALKKTVEIFLKTRKQMAYVRRWREDVIGRKASLLWEGINASGIIAKLTDGEYEGVCYFSGKFFLCRYEDNGKPIYSDADNIGFSFALTDTEHNKSTSFPNVTTIIFDEFLTNKTYLNDEFVLFMNTVSTIVRRRTDVTIYMLGNTVNKFCPYFNEMGLTNIQQMKQGTIDVYSYGESGLTVAVEYCAPTATGAKDENKYFAFDNPRLKMITSGAWELDIYPHLPVKYLPKHVIGEFFIDFNDVIYHGEIISIKDLLFIYFHLKTTPIKDTSNDLIYSLEPNVRPNYNMRLNETRTRIQRVINNLFATDKVFYQDNNVGNAIANYIKFSSH